MMARKLPRGQGSCQDLYRVTVLTWGAQERRGKEQEGPGGHDEAAAEAPSTPRFMEAGNLAV